MIKLFDKLLNMTFVRFLIVGIFNTIVGLGLMLFLFNIIKMHYWYATFIANVCGATVSYFLNKKFTFRSKVDKSKSIPRFIIIILLCYTSSYFISNIIVTSIASLISYNFTSQFLGNISMLLGMCFYTVINYVGQKLFVFNINN